MTRKKEIEFSLQIQLRLIKDLQHRIGFLEKQITENESKADASLKIVDRENLVNFGMYSAFASAQERELMNAKAYLKELEQSIELLTGKGGKNK
ncbi:hypothetical protein M3215_06985 [Bacillus cytotoxicus]|uniref:Uncharacterized protein n=1 Tax=Bacillus cytotoxicus TaxID=580165 RepID=A0ACC6A4D5_9BACI|nr:hypothetical protein [Bacillus cytotoxicus]